MGDSKQTVRASGAMMPGRERIPVLVAKSEHELLDDAEVFLGMVKRATTDQHATRASAIRNLKNVVDELELRVARCGWY